MEMLWFIFVLAWVGSLLICGSFFYRKGRDAKKLIIESLSFRQAMKWWAYHEILRHNDDIRNIRDDIRKLATVEMPKGIDYAAWVDIEGNPKVKSKRQSRNPLA
jgi:hypothetical protein